MMKFGWKYCTKELSQPLFHLITRLTLLNYILNRQTKQIWKNYRPWSMFSCLQTFRPLLWQTYSVVMCSLWHLSPRHPVHIWKQKKKRSITSSFTGRQYINISIVQRTKDTWKSNPNQTRNLVKIVWILLSAPIICLLSSNLR